MQARWLALFYAAYFGFVGLYSPFLGPYLTTLGHSLDVVALALGMMQLMRIVGPFAWGWLSDRTANRIRWIQVASLGGACVAVAVFTFERSAFALVMLVLLMNLFISGLVPMSDAHCMEMCKNDPGRYGRIRLFGSVGFVIAVLVFGAMASKFGYASYPVWACACLFLAYWASRQFQPAGLPPSTSSSIRHGLEAAPGWRVAARELLWSRGLARLWLASYFMVLAHGVFYGYFSLYLIEHGYAEASIGLLWAFGVVCEVLFFWFQSAFFHRLSLKQWMCWGYGVCAVRFAVTALFPQYWPIMALAQSAHAITFAAHHTATIAWLKAALPFPLQVRGQAMYATIAYGLGGTSGTLLGRWAWGAFGPSSAFGLAALAGLLALWLGVHLRENVMPASAHPSAA
ncbi:MAG: MFS transporter [Limnobacter sp.]|uniref:MFS transporter n=1 Tax=Limnobacter sp. TaxID=2003368 RepID=UPI003919132C